MSLSVRVMNQRGIALILALLVVALVTAITVELSWRFDLSMNRAANRWYGVQAYGYLNAVEEVVFIMLQIDADEDKNTENGPPKDTPNDVWNSVTEWTDEFGWAKWQVVDAQGRFNLNWLIKKVTKPQQGFKKQADRWTAPQKRFIRLLQTLEVEEETFMDVSAAEAITAAIIDWVDEGSEETYFMGAESDYYSRLEPPVVMRNMPMLSATELSVIRGITPQLYQKLLPLVIALPEDTTLNVNTMPAELFRTIVPKDDLIPASVEAAQMLMQNRDLAGYYNNIDDFKQDIGFEGVDTTGMGVTSSYFLVFADAAIGEYIRHGSSLIYRGDDQITTLRRTDANF